MPIAPDGQQAADFLSSIFTEDTSQRPEFMLGPASLRRVELQKLASLINEDFRPGLGALAMVPTVVDWMITGRFDHLVKATRAGGNIVDLEREKAHTAEISVLNHRLEAMETMFRDFASAGDSQAAMERMRAFVDGGRGVADEIAADPILSGRATVATMDPENWEEIEAMAIKDLRAYARELGVPFKGRDRDDILVDLRAKLLIDPIDLTDDDEDDEGQTEDETDVENAA